MPRLTRYGLYFTVLSAMTLLIVSVRKHGADPAPSSRPLNDWDIPELAFQLKRMGMEVRLQAVSKNGPLSHSAYLTSTAKEWRDLNLLSKDPRRIHEWRGTIYCERVGDSEMSHLLEQWGDRYLAIRPFIFYGDPELLDRVRIALDPLAQKAAS